MAHSVKVAICGVKGYVGQSLLKLVLQHPNLDLVGVIVRENSSKIHGLGSSIACFTADALEQKSPDLLLLATPPDVSMEFVSRFKSSGIKIIDLSGAYRLAADQAETVYGTKPLAGLEAGAHYGLSPFMPPASDCRIIANPGCYATCVLMALIPLVNNSLIKKESIIIDAKSGASGAGKQVNQHLMFCEMAQNFFPYKINQHRHVPEMLYALSRLDCDSAVKIRFVPHVLPMIKGMSAALYLDSAIEFANRDEALQNIQVAYQQAYNDYPFVEFAAINSDDAERDRWLLSVKSVVNTPKVHIAYEVDDDGKIFIFSAIDNLLKGAASQAIENINALYQWPITTGL